MLFKKHSNHQIDFTKGSILKNTITFSIPVLLGSLLQHLYNTIDTIVVGNFTGEEALAAVSVCNTASKLIVAIFSGISIGAGIVISKAFGYGNKKMLKRRIQQLVTFSVFLGIACSVIGLIFAKPLLTISNAREDYFDQAYTYLAIIYGGAIFTCVYNFCAGALRAIGDSSVTLKILAFTGLANAILDFILVKYFHMGVAGAAIATVFAEALSVYFGLRSLSKKIEDKVFKPKEMYYFGKKPIMESLGIGVSIAVQSAVLSFSNLFVLSYVNKFPTAMVAGVATAQKIDAFAMLPPDTISSSISTAIGQNIGAGTYDRIKKYAITGIGLSAAITIAINLVLVSFAPFLVSLFNGNPEVIESGSNMVRTLVPLYIICALRYALVSNIRPYGKTFWSSVFVIFGMVICRQIFLMLTVTGPDPDIQFVYYCYPVGWMCSFIPMAIYYFFVRKKLKGLGKKDKSNTKNEII